MRVVTDQQRADLAELLPSIAPRPCLIDDLLLQSAIERERPGRQFRVEGILEVRRSGSETAANFASRGSVACIGVCTALNGTYKKNGSF